MVSSEELKKELAELTTGKRLPGINVVSRPQNVHILVHDRPAVDFTVRDSLSLVKHPLVLKAATQALQSYGPGGYSSRTQTGTSELHRLAEARICEISGYKSALLFTSRNQAIWTLLSCLLDERDVVLVDDYSSGPYADAAHLVHCDCLSFTTLTLSSLKSALERTTPKRRKLAILSSINSDSGKLQKITDFWPFISSAGAGLIVDETYSFGLLGSRGGGVFDHLAVLDRPLAALLDFSALLGFNCAAIAGTPELIALVIAYSRTLANELALPPHICAALVQALDLSELAITERQKLTELVDQAYRGLNTQDWKNLSAPDIPVLNLRFTDLHKAAEFQEGLTELGIVCELVPPGSTRSEHCFLRFYITLNHSQADILKLLQAISTVKSKS